ncbi:hypothetical protein [Spirosoma endophyticum]|uniref:Uncharacterized protein n=1 Tax=Spirosoma endophyticum TaxID=662367 RepID=A0A1I1W7P8_9BACT|nr:hypothetical protein [Spirosoma endophyticum]SFD91236.1 hypothetical protein SAMN05216167_108169 [Spirosoma endophyticum]
MFIRLLFHSFALSTSVAALIISGCARQPQLTAELTLRTLNAVNLEETLSRRDELMMAYSLTSYDAQNKPVGVVNGGWGVETVKKGQLLDFPASEHPARPIQLALPKNGKIVASLILVEVDDYNQAKQTLAKIQKIHNVVSIPATLLLTAAEVLTPLKYVSAGLVASGVGLQLADKLDNDDVLGQSSVELYEAALRQKKQRFIKVPVVFSGKNQQDSFEYKLEYDITLKTVKIQAVRQ